MTISVYERYRHAEHKYNIKAFQAPSLLLGHIVQQMHGNTS